MKMPGCHENINFHTKKGNQKKIRGCCLQHYEVTWLCSWICNVLLYPGTYYLTSLNFSFMFLKHVVIVQLLTHVCLCGPMNCNMPGFPVFHYLLEFQVHVPWIGDAIQPSHPLPPSSPFAFNLSQCQGLFQWAGSSHQVAKLLALQRQHQTFQWIFRVDFL